MNIYRYLKSESIEIAQLSPKSERTRRWKTKRSAAGFVIYKKRKKRKETQFFVFSAQTVTTPAVNCPDRGAGFHHFSVAIETLWLHRAAQKSSSVTSRCQRHTAGELQPLTLSSSPAGSKCVELTVGSFWEDLGLCVVELCCVTRASIISSEPVWRISRKHTDFKYFDYMSWWFSI